jgi:hypothetical protein
MREATFFKLYHYPLLRMLLSRLLLIYSHVRFRRFIRAIDVPKSTFVRPKLFVGWLLCQWRPPIYPSGAPVRVFCRQERVKHNPPSHRKMGLRRPQTGPPCRKRCG